MRPCSRAVGLAILGVAVMAACPDVPARDGDAAGSPRRLAGRVLLPPGEGSRGVEVVVTVEAPGGDAHETWLLFDEGGRFAHTFRGRLVRLTVSTGLRAELHRIEADALPGVEGAGEIDVGAIDLRGRLMRHRMVLRAAEGAPPGDVRVAMCFGPPPVGPRGEPIALGSRQFPPVALGGEVEWLLPHDAADVRFLVERPHGPGGGEVWRSGRQRLFGPFTAAMLPAELIVD